MSLHAVTGAFGFTGKYITQRLLARGHQVRTITGNPDRPNPFGDVVEARPFDFENPDLLAESLRGAEVFYITYWVRYAYGGTTYDQAVENTKTLFRAAKSAGVRRVVYVSIANPSVDSELPYYRSKALLEQDLHGLGVSHAIVRPTVIFGKEDILINNIAYFLRKYPVFVIPGNGKYGIQPIFVADLADLCIAAGDGRANETFDAVGPEAYTFRGLIEKVRGTVGSRSTIIHMSPGMAYRASKVLGRAVRDVVLTWEEVKGLMGNRLVSHEPPRGTTKLSDYLDENARTIGTEYASEVARHYR